MGWGGPMKAKPSSVSTEVLLQAARRVREHAVALHSGVKVGAALVAVDGTIITGCNVESPSNIEGMCAERVALLKALSEGHREFVRVAVIADFPKPIPPCGFCRQILFEFAPDLEIIMANIKGDTKTARLLDLLPEAYRIEDREGG